MSLDKGHWGNLVLENQTRAHKRGRKPPKIKGKTLLFGADCGLSRAYRGLSGADRDEFLRTPHSHGCRGEEQKWPFFGPSGAFRANPPVC